jgi:hypothetical protein
MNKHNLRLGDSCIIKGTKYEVVALLGSQIGVKEGEYIVFYPDYLVELNIENKES